MRIILTYGFLCSVIFGLFAQSRQELKGDFYYNHKQYSEGIIHYKKALKKGSTNLALQYKLYKSYQFTKNYKLAFEGFENLINKNHQEENIYFDYAMLAKNHQKYDLAREALKLHLELYPMDDKALELFSSLNHVTDFYESKDQVDIKLLSVNTVENDLGGFYLDDKFCFLTGGFDKSRRLYHWDNQHFLNFHELDQTAPDGYKKTLPKLHHGLHNGPGIYSTKMGLLFYTRNDKMQPTKEEHEKISRLQIYTYDPNSSSSTPESISLNNKNYSIAHPAISPGGNRLFFSSDMPNGYGQSDLYYSDFEEGIGWSTPVNLGPQINTELKENFPFVVNDTTFFFSSDGHGGLGGLDLFKAVIRADGSVDIMNMNQPFNSVRDDFGIIFNPNDPNTGYFSSNRTGGKGHDDLYSFEYKKVQIWLQVVSAKSNKPITFANINISNQSDSYAMAIKDEFQKIDINESDIASGLLFKLEHFYYHDLEFECKGFKNNDTIVIKMIDKQLNPIRGTITDLDTHEPLGDVTVSLAGQKGVEDISTALGGYSLYSQSKGPQKIQLHKKGYLSKEIEIADFNRLKPYDVELEKLKEGMSIKLDKIHYEFDEYFLTEDSKIILNELIQIMLDNPKMEIEMKTHTDERGSTDYNQDLATKRALSVTKYLSLHGVAIFRVSSRVYGELSPSNDCIGDCSEDEHYENRRSEFKITKI